MSNEDHLKDTPKTNKQTNKHQALHPPVLLALASGSCRTALLTNLCVAFTCQTQNATAKKIKLRKRLFFVVITVNGFISLF